MLIKRRLSLFAGVIIPVLFVCYIVGCTPCQMSTFLGFQRKIVGYNDVKFVKNLL